MFDVIGVAQDKHYQVALANALASIRGIEHKEDAESAAIVALLEQEPITMDDCIDTMRKAVERQRNRIRKIARNETSIEELFND
jgi:hypothetical protein